MKDRENGSGRDVEPLLESLGRGHDAPEENDLRELARAAATTKRTHYAPRRQPFALRWMGAGVGAALLAGSALGFGLGASLTPSGSAGTNFAGTGFLPARGWSVVQSGQVDAAGASRAIAATVPLRSEDWAQDVPYAALRSLPGHGIVIVATFTTRGDPGVDFGYPVRTLPLQIADATRSAGGEYRLRAGVRGTNADVRIYFGTADATREMQASAQRQLSRLAVASERVTIFARPTILDSGPITVFGSVANGRAGEEVVIQARDCGSSFFRVFAGAETRDGGGYSTLMYPRVTTTMRAVWGDAASNQVTVQVRASVSLLRQRTGDGFRVAAGGIRSFWRKHVLVQERRGSAWRTVKKVVLTDSVGTIAGAGSWTEAKFRLPGRKGTLIRAVLPLSQAKPCYLAGVSRTLRT
jgi:hypothetical protein